MVKYLLMFVAIFSYVTIRAFQQRNVAFDNYRWIVPTCYAMQALDIYVVSTVARNGLNLPLVICNGTAATLGCFAAMWFHKRFVKK